MAALWIRGSLRGPKTQLLSFFLPSYQLLTLDVESGRDSFPRNCPVFPDGEEPDVQGWGGYEPGALPGDWACD